MNSLCIPMDAPGAGVSLDQLVGKLLESFSGARVTCDDWYRQFRQVAERIIEERSGVGSPIPRSDAILRDIDEAAQFVGQRKVLQIPMASGTYLKADITARSLTLISESPLRGNETVTAICNCMRSMGITTQMESPK